MDKQLQAIVTVLSLVNPMVCAMIFAQLEGSRTRKEKVADATKAAFAVVVVLALAALFGIKILGIFGVSLDAFSVAGGIVLAQIGFSMLSGQSNASASDASKRGETNLLSPLILFAASPGTITGVITIAAAHGDSRFPVTALVAVLVASTVMWGALVLMSRSAKESSSGGFVRDTATRFMGLIVVAMGIQFALTGFRAFMK